LSLTDYLGKPVDCELIELSEEFYSVTVCNNDYPNLGELFLVYLDPALNYEPKVVSY